MISRDFFRSILAGVSIIYEVAGLNLKVEGGSGGPPPAGAVGAAPPCSGVQWAEGPRPKMKSKRL